MNEQPKITRELYKKIREDHRKAYEKYDPDWKEFYDERAPVKKSWREYWRVVLSKLLKR
jgi:hypothetical protein